MPAQPLSLCSNLPGLLALSSLLRRNMFSAHCGSRVSLSNAMKIAQSLSVWTYANCSIAGSIRMYANPIARDAIRRAAEGSTHPGSGHMDGSRLANIPNVEGSTTAACRYLAIVSGLVWATRMNSAFLSSYYPRCICAGCPAGVAIPATSG